MQRKVIFNIILAKQKIIKIMDTILIVNGNTVNEGVTKKQDIFIKKGRIERIDSNLQHLSANKIIDAQGKIVIPGIIDDQVHFREPGLTQKGDLSSESRAAVAGGITTFMEMPNTGIQTVTQDLLEKKYALGQKKSLANYSFYMGTTNNNLKEVLKTNPKTVCGIKVFMGSSTGNMLVDDEKQLRHLFAESPTLIATHCEKENIIKENEKLFLQKYGEDINVAYHPKIRSVQACLESSQQAIALAKEFNSRLHVLHLTTADEIDLFDNSIPLEKKRITAEVCVHHLYFSANDYEQLKSKIKCNPAIKGIEHRNALRNALLNNKLDVIATDHAPHTWAEKNNPYFNSPSGIPLVQHSLQTMLELVSENVFSLEFMVEKMCHSPSKCFQIKERGFLRESYWADITIINPQKSYQVNKDNILYKCKWSPFQGHTFNSTITHTIVSGHIAYENGNIINHNNSQRLLFDR